MNDKDKLISFINKGKEDNRVKEVHVIKDSDTENHILLVNEDGTSIASNKFEVKNTQVESTEFVCADYGFEIYGKAQESIDIGAGITTRNTDVINKAAQFINLFSSKESFSKYKCSISIEINSLGIYTEVSNLYPMKNGDYTEINATIYFLGNAYAEILIQNNSFKIGFVFIEPIEEKLIALRQIMTALATSGKITFNILEL